MCGINGIVSKNKVPRLKERLSKMNMALKHRGPNANEIEVVSNELGFGHRRLSIIDLDKRSNQPLYSNSRKTLIVYNGEIFNYKEIKKDLINEYEFNTNSDTEVILAAYEIYGLDWFLKRANGMFAFALYDILQKKIFLVQDRFGIKPLFYYLENDVLVFSSEIKGILNSGLVKAEFNYTAIDEYLGNRYIREPYTFFNNIYQLKAAKYLIVNHNLEVTEKDYWQLPKLNFNEVQNETEIIEATDQKLQSTIKKWLISDVKVGTYLSGGLDSSVTTAMIAKMRGSGLDTYNIGFQEVGFNEFEYAREIAKLYSTNHHELLINDINFIDEWKKLIWYKDAPLSVPNEVPLAIMSNKLSKDITVVISGEGADELFGGYGKIFRTAFDFDNHDIKDSFYNFFINKYEYTPRYVRDKYLLRSDNYRDFYDMSLKNEFENYNNQENIFRFFHKFHIKGLLQRVDMTTMQTSVEGRPPFLDHELIEFVYTNVPYELKLKWKNLEAREKAKKMNSSVYSEDLDIPKYILKNVAKKYIPINIINRKKIGFPVPLNGWYPRLEEFAKIELNETEWLKHKSVKELCQDLNQTDRSGQILWMFINIELFNKIYFNKEWRW